MVRDFKPLTRRFIVEWDGGGGQKEVTRLNLLFTGEDKKVTKLLPSPVPSRSSIGILWLEICLTVTPKTVIPYKDLETRSEAARTAQIKADAQRALRARLSHLMVESPPPFAMGVLARPSELNLRS